MNGDEGQMNRISTLSRDLENKYSGPFGPRFWLLDSDGGIVVRGWRVGRNGKPMGEDLACCRTVADAMAWIEIEARKH